MKKVLVVDDNIDILTVVQLILSTSGFHVETVSKWRKLEECIDKFHPDIILLDIALGDADGRDICITLKSEEKTSQIPVILFSANYNLESTFTDFRANDFIAKPFETRHLVAKIKEHT